MNDEIRRRKWKREWERRKTPNEGEKEDRAVVAQGRPFVNLPWGEDGLLTSSHLFPSLSPTVWRQRKLATLLYCVRYKKITRSLGKTYYSAYGALNWRGIDNLPKRLRRYRREIGRCCSPWKSWIVLQCHSASDSSEEILKTAKTNGCTVQVNQNTE